MVPRGFLIDENLPAPLRFVLPGVAQHARDLGESCTDTVLWEVARREALVILTRDADFYDRVLLATPPPRVVQVACGNLRRRDLLALLEESWPAVEGLLPEHKPIRVTTGGVEGIA